LAPLRYASTASDVGALALRAFVGVFGVRLTEPAENTLEPQRSTQAAKTVNRMTRPQSIDAAPRAKGVNTLYTAMQSKVNRRAGFSRRGGRGSTPLLRGRGIADVDYRIEERATRKHLEPEAED
jgi:hypothetical protein